MSVNKMIHFVKEKFKGTYKERKIREIWGRYKCVSHLWASNIDLYNEATGFSALEIPHYEGLYHLLTRAEGYQNFGLEYWPRYKKKMLFTKDDLWTIPKNLPKPNASSTVKKKSGGIKAVGQSKKIKKAQPDYDDKEFEKHASKWLRKQFKGYGRK